MTPIDDKIRARQRLRLQILEIMYGAVDGNTNAFVTRQALSEDLRIEQRALSYEIDFLFGEHLLALHGPQGIMLTHEGICEVEEMRTRPDESTRHFLALNVLNVGTMVSSQINQASPSSAQPAAAPLSPIAHGEAILDAVERMEHLVPQQRTELTDTTNRLLALLRAIAGHT